jgi:F-type H+-transporting ATPase subunit b
MEEITRTFGVNWPHLVAQMISFGIVCVLLQVFAYKPILRILEVRRRQIAAGLANAEKIRYELAGIEAERRSILASAGARGDQLIEEARVAAARAGRAEIAKATADAEQILARARAAADRDRARMLADLKRHVGRLVVRTTAAVTGKVLTPDDHHRLLEEAAGQLR